MTAIKPQLLKYLAAALIFAIAMGLRLGALTQTTIDDPLQADAAQYYLYALHLKYHHTFSGSDFHSNQVPEPDAARAPLYPLFLTAFVVAPPTDVMIWKILFAQVLLGSLTVIIILSVFRQFMPEGWAITAALLTALSPHLIMINNYMLSETLFMFLLALSLWVLVRMHANSSRKLALLAGSVIALAALTRPTLQYFIVPLFFLLALGTGQRFNLRLAVPLAVGFFLTFTPWTLRNLHETGSISDPTLAINALHHGMYPDFRYQDEPETTGYPYKYDPRSAEIASSKGSVVHEIRRRFAEEPGRHLAWYLLGKPVTLLSWDSIQGFGDAFIYPMSTSPYNTKPLFMHTRLLMKHLHWPLVMLSLVASLLVWVPAFGTRLSRNMLFTARLLSLLMIYFIALHTIASPFPRYGTPIRPAIYGLAIMLCAQCLLWLKALPGVLSPQHPDSG